MDGWNVVYPQSRLLLSHKKERGTDTYYNMNDPWKHDTKWKATVRKDHLLYDCIYVKCPEQVNPLGQKWLEDTWGQGGGGFRHTGFTWGAIQML